MYCLRDRSRDDLRRFVGKAARSVIDQDLNRKAAFRSG
jgi:hypothetical protein